MSSWLNDSIDDPNLRQSVEDLIKAYPASSRVLERMVRYYDNKPSDREAKRRKIEENDLSSTEVFRLLEVSFQLPARKKFNLIITKTHLLLHNSKTDIIEFKYNLNDISPYGGSCVPSPDKATKCNTFTLFLNNEDCIVFNSQDKVDMVLRKSDNSTDETLTQDKHEIICNLLTEHARVKISQPSKDIFRSTGVSSTTGKTIEDKSHVVAYLKAKDGFLFFLPTGILFGFKKPTLFFPITSLASNVITNITQRTFDLTLTIKPGSHILGTAGFRPSKEGENDIVQFSMIEQSEYGGIEAYTKKLGINDQSMAEERKAVIFKNTEVKDKEENEQNEQDEDSEENDDDFEPSDNDNEPLEYDTDAEDEEDEEEADKELQREELHEYEDAMEEEDDDDEQDLLDEDDD